ncbi:MAG: hypothetical protein OEZ02_06320 [Anaerolineae bacterium]|nr:hypothetical protein [Anaerolineae bacterium]
MSLSFAFLSSLAGRISAKWLGIQNRFHLLRLTRQVAKLAVSGDKQPVVFFNASARIHGLNLNAAFSLLASWGLRLAGVPVVHFVCQAGMSRCVLGTDRDNHIVEPPCKACIAQSNRLYARSDTHAFTYSQDEALTAALQGLDMVSLGQFEYQGQPLGQMVLPSLRWILRRHHLPDDNATRYLMRQYILSAFNIARQFEALLDRVNPAAVVVFNGTMYPEAAARRAAQQRGIRVISHEVSFQPFSAFFTEGQATAYPIDIPDDFELSAEQNAQLDSYLESRFQGEFTMAGITFWPEMRGLDDDFLRKIRHFDQVVPVFTNVIFDTSQVHANTLFPHMFAWLDMLLELIENYPQTLFVIRAHPDEMRPGTKKQSRESVRQWVERHQIAGLPNVVFIDSQEYVSSYALIQRAKFVMVYNSSIGLEASLMGAAVLCGGKARYTQYPTVFFPQTAQAYRQQAEEFLTASSIDIPESFRQQARRFLYYQLYRTALPFGDFLHAHPRLGYVGLKPFPLEKLSPQHSTAVRVIVDGVVNHRPFLV